MHGGEQNVLKIICKGRIYLLVFTRSGYNCILLFVKFSHGIVKIYFNLLIKPVYIEGTFGK